MRYLKKFDQLNENMKSDLADYIEKGEYRRAFNFGNKSLYKQLGEYIVEAFGDDLPEELKVELNDDYPLPEPMTHFNREEINYSSLAIFFFTSFMDLDLLKKIFGEPLLHSEFGEGFEEEYNIQEDCASYFVDINGVKFHITTDQTGTSFEVKNTSEKQTLEALKKFIDEVANLYIVRQLIPQDPDIEIQ